MIAALLSFPEAAMLFLTTRSSLAVLLLAPGIATAQPPKQDEASPLPRILALKPVAASEDDSPIRKLQKERFNARLAAAQMQYQRLQIGAVTSDGLRQLPGLVARMAEDRADLELNPADRVKWLELRVEVLREYERIARRRVEAGTSNPDEVSLATAARADAEIDLLRLQESLKKGKDEK
jgi:hypothetical protein